MPIETGFYSNLKPVEIPSLMDSAKGAMSMRQLAAQTDAQNIENKARAAEHDINQIGAFAKLAEGAVDQESWERAIGQAQEMGWDVSQVPAQFDKGLRDAMLYNAYRQSDRLAAEGQKFNQGLATQKQDLDERKFGVDKRKTQAEINKLNAEAYKATQYGTKYGADGELIGSKPLPPDKILAVNEGNTVPTLLSEIRSSLEANSDMFGPVSGRLASWNPYNEKSQTMDAQLRTAAQAFGRFMEGGVLRKEDEEKYRKMFPNLSDTPQVAANKLALVERMLLQKQDSNVEALAQQGYNTAGVRRDNGAAPEIPAVLSGSPQRRSGGAVPNAHAAPPPRPMSKEEFLKQWKPGQ